MSVQGVQTVLLANPYAQVVQPKEIVRDMTWQATVFPWPYEEEKGKHKAVARGSEAWRRRRSTGRRADDVPAEGQQGAMALSAGRKGDLAVRFQA